MLQLLLWIFAMFSSPRGIFHLSSHFLFSHVPADQIVLYSNALLSLAFERGFVTDDLVLTDGEIIPGARGEFVFTQEVADAMAHCALEHIRGQLLVTDSVEFGQWN